jgi:hypothetical protein
MIYSRGNMSTYNFKLNGVKASKHFVYAFADKNLVLQYNVGLDHSLSSGLERIIQTNSTVFAVLSYGDVELVYTRNNEDHLITAY